MLGESLFCGKPTNTFRDSSNDCPLRARAEYPHSPPGLEAPPKSAQFRAQESREGGGPLQSPGKVFEKGAELHSRWRDRDSQRRGLDPCHVRSGVRTTALLSCRYRNLQVLALSRPVTQPSSMGILLPSNGSIWNGSHFPEPGTRVPLTGAFLPTLLSRFMFWTFPFFLICILCTSVSPAGV